jgi:response regulator NasT
MTEVRCLRVLIANERRDRLDLLAGVVAGLGHEVIARSVQVAKVGAVTTRERPDVALVGLGASSEHALDLISDIVHEASCPVIALLATNDPSYVRQAARRGVFAYIAHDDPADLQSAIDITLQRFAEHQNLQGAFGRRAVIEQAKGILKGECHEDAQSSQQRWLRSRSSCPAPRSRTPAQVQLVHCSAAPPLPVATPSPAPVTPAPVPAAIKVLADRARSAPTVRLAVQAACASRHVRVTVSGRLMRQVRASVNGTHARALNVTSGARSITTPVALGRTGARVQMVTTRVSFRNGARARTMSAPARRCSPVTVTPP